MATFGPDIRTVFINIVRRIFSVTVNCVRFCLFDLSICCSETIEASYICHSHYLLLKSKLLLRSQLSEGRYFSGVATSGICG